MAIAKRTTSKSHRSTRAASSRPAPLDRKASHKIAELLYSFTNQIKPVPFGNPALEMLTRSQRLRLAELHSTTGVTSEKWVRLAVEHFLEDEAPIYKMRSRRLAA